MMQIGQWVKFRTAIWDGIKFLVDSVEVGPIISCYETDEFKKMVVVQVGVFRIPKAIDEVSLMTDSDLMLWKLENT